MSFCRSIGEEEGIGLILTLRTERYSNKVAFSTFQDKLKNYVLTNFEEAKDIISLIDNLKDPQPDSISAQPKNLSTNDAKNQVLVWMKQEQVKKHINRLTTLENNKETLYGVVWGQCTSGLQEVLKGDDDLSSSTSTAQGLKGMGSSGGDGSTCSSSIPGSQVGWNPAPGSASSNVAASRPASDGFSGFGDDEAGPYGMGSHGSGFGAGVESSSGNLQIPSSPSGKEGKSVPFLDTPLDPGG